MAAGLAAAALALELLLRALPVSTATMTGYHIDADVLTYPPGHAWTVSTGWDLRNVQRLRANNWGFVSPRDFTPDPQAVALIGDSYVEASMLAPQQRPSAQLESFLGGGRSVYALGSPGTALIDHAQRVRLASERLKVRDFVIWLEQGDVRQSLCGSGNVHSRCLDPRSLQLRIERLPPPSGLKAWARHSALAQYFVGQLKLRPSALLKSMFTRMTPEGPAGQPAPHQNLSQPAPELSERSRRMVDAVVDQFFRDAGPHLRGRLLIVIDGRRSGPPSVPAEDDLQRRYLIERLNTGGAEVIDLEPVYARHAQLSRRRLEVGPYDAHLNGLGVALVMQAVAGGLQSVPSTRAEVSLR